MSMLGLEVYENVLSKETCNEIIRLFEADDRKEPGKNSSGVNDKKVSTDIYCNFLNDEFEQYNKLIIQNVGEQVARFREKYLFLDHADDWHISGPYNIQRYNDGEGYFKAHCEQGGQQPYRMLAWMIYLTDSLCGTEFPYQEVIVEAKKGNMAIWSAGWTHPHKGVTPNIGTKYILTGWGHYIAHGRSLFQLRDKRGTDKEVSQ